MDQPRSAERARFVVLITSPSQERHARLAIESLRAYGGPLSACPVWLYESDRTAPPSANRGPAVTPGAAGLADLAGVERVQLALNTRASRYLFGPKVWACADAEARADRTGITSLVWLSPESLIVQPPTLFELGPGLDAAFRTVHHRNIGAVADEPLDPFWTRVYQAVGLSEAPFTVESFADPQRLRPYFNSHCFAIDPALGVCHAWRALFEALTGDAAFQDGACRDDLHRVFLHQAILSALIARDVPRARLRMLPPGYSYPLHMHDQVPPGRRARSLDELVCPVHEGQLSLGDLNVSPLMRAWLDEHGAFGTRPDHA